jgi:hypothetical protein
VWPIGAALGRRGASASRTDAVKIDVVSDVSEVVLAAQATGVFFDVHGSKCHGSAAPAADQVVTMTCPGTQAVEDLAVLGALGLGDLVGGQRAQDAVDAGETDPQLSVSANLQIELLGAAKVLLLPQDLEDGTLLGRGTSPPGLRRRRHQEHPFRRVG